MILIITILCSIGCFSLSLIFAEKAFNCLYPCSTFPVYDLAFIYNIGAAGFALIGIAFVFAGVLLIVGGKKPFE